MEQRLGSLKEALYEAIIDYVGNVHSGTDLRP